MIRIAKKAKDARTAKAANFSNPNFGSRVNVKIRATTTQSDKTMMVKDIMRSRLLGSFSLSPRKTNQAFLSRKRRILIAITVPVKNAKIIVNLVPNTATPDFIEDS